MKKQLLQKSFSFLLFFSFLFSMGGEIYAQVKTPTKYKGILEWSLPGFVMEGTLAHYIIMQEGTEEGTDKLLMPKFEFEVSFMEKSHQVKISTLELDNLIIDTEGNFVPQKTKVEGAALNMVVEPELDITGSLKDNKLVMNAAGSFNVMGMDVAITVVFNGQSVNTGLERLLANSNVRIYTEDNSIVIEGAQGNAVEIYSVAGQLLKAFMATERESLNVEQGMYIIKVGNKVEKVLVR